MKLFLILLALVGVVMIATTHDSPRYRAGWTPGSLGAEPVGDSKAASQRYYAAQAENRTRASRVGDVGYGLAAFAMTALALLFASGLGGLRSFATFRSPSRRRTLWAWALGGWCFIILASVRWLEYTAVRGDFPWWADTIVIGYVELMFQGVLGAVAIMAILTVSLRRVELPARVGDLAPTTGRFWIATAIAGTLIVLLFIGAYSAMVSGSALLTCAHVLCLGGVIAWWPAAAAPRSV
jgi:hypothetical protein